MCGIIFDRSARSIFARGEALVAALETNEQLTVRLCGQIQTLVFEIKRINHLLLCCEDFITWSLVDAKFLFSF